MLATAKPRLTRFDPHAAFDVEAFFAAIPPHAEVRGLFYQIVRDAYQGTPLPAPETPQTAFGYYPRVPYLRLLIAAGEKLHPASPVSGALYEIGRTVYPRFARTLVGKAVFALAGRDFKRIAMAAPRAYASATNHGSVFVERERPGSVEIRLLNMYDPPGYTVGIWQGALDVCGEHDATIRHRVEGPDAHTLFIEW